MSLIPAVLAILTALSGGSAFAPQNVPAATPAEGISREGAATSSSPVAPTFERRLRDRERRLRDGWKGWAKGFAYFVAFVGAVAAALGLPLLWGRGEPIFATMAAAMFLLLFGVLVWGIVWGQVTPNRSRPQVLPYFEQRLDGTDTFLAGYDLLRHSRALDETAERLSLRPLSTFESGDDLKGEELRWFSARDALPTVEGLLADLSENDDFPAEVTSDLACLREALQRACARDVRFCLLLRQQDRATLSEMDARRGSFF
jgi:hypothetical protein